MPAVNFYRECPVPKNLSFDEESLFWRLRLGEGIPNRDWHKPLDSHKTWHEIKLSLDKKLGAEKTNALFQNIYPQPSFLRRILKKFILSLKKSFLLLD